MTNLIETVDVVEPWLYATLSGDATLAGLVGTSISGTLSPEILTPPYVTFLMQSSLDVTEVGGIVISTDNLYVVKAVARSASWDSDKPIANRINQLIHRPGSTMIQGSGSLTCTRQSIVQYPEVEEGIQYRHLGGIYRIRASNDT